METAAALLLCLPRRMCGYGFERPAMNYRLSMDQAIQLRGEGSYCLCDLFWSAARVGIEYDSDPHHAQRENLYHDALRRNRLSSLDVEMLTLMRDQLYNLAKFDVVARHLARPFAPCVDDPVWKSRALEFRRELLGPCGFVSGRLVRERGV